MQNFRIFAETCLLIAKLNVQFSPLSNDTQPSKKRSRDDDESPDWCEGDD